MSALLFSRDGMLVTGVEDDRETGGTRVYVGPRFLNQYALLVDPEMCERARMAWRGSSGHLLADAQDLWPFHNEGRAA